MKRIISFATLLGFAIMLNAQGILSLDSCRALAIANNKNLQISKEKVKAAYYEKKAAFTNYLPEFSAMGTYMRNQKEFSLLNGDQKDLLSNIGTLTNAQIQGLIPQISAADPLLGAILQQVGSQIAGPLNGVGNGLVDGLRTDTRNIYAGAITLTQPLYMGGKIRAYNKITKYAEQLAQSQHNTELQEVILNTDQAYWQVISLVNKKELAESYLKLLQKLDSDIDKMIAEGVATKADGLSVKVKVNEAEMTLTKVEDGLSLSKMVLCQLCGLPINMSIQLADENIKDFGVESALNTAVDMDAAFSKRPELQSLGLATDIYKQKINITRSEHLPSLALTGNYMVTNPSVFNSFENKFKGMWSVGVMLKIPIWHWGEGIYKVKAAKAQAHVAQYQLADAKEKIELQVNQSVFKVNEAAKKLIMAKKNMEKADENLRYANLGFEEGVIPPSDVLEAHTAWLSAQSERIDAQIDVKLTDVYLQKAIGTLNINE